MLFEGAWQTRPDEPIHHFQSKSAGKSRSFMFDSAESEIAHNNQMQGMVRHIIPHEKNETSQRQSASA